MQRLTKRMILFNKNVKPFLFMLLVGFSLMAINACQNDQNKEEAATADAQESIQTKDTLANTEAFPEAEALESLNGKYPRDVKLLDRPELEPRLEALLGDQYEAFRKNWQTETPIIVEDNVLSTSGCEQHNCAANQYVLQIDLKGNNINVHHFGSEVQHFKENGRSIALPEGLAKEFETINQNNF